MSVHASFRHLLYGAGLIVVSALLVLAGCSTSNSPFSPQMTTGTTHIIPATQFVPLTLHTSGRAGIMTKPVFTTKRVLAADGGAVEVVGNIYKYSVDVPSDALPQDADMSITVPDDGSALIALGPHGVQFKTPVTLEISAEFPGTNYGLLKKTLDIYWYNPDTGMWEAQGATISKQGSTITARVQLNHFSQYALGGQ